MSLSSSPPTPEPAVKNYKSKLQGLDIYSLPPTKAGGTYERLAAKLTKTNLLILDDWGLATVSASDGRDLLDILDDGTSLSTCIVSQLLVEIWHSQFSDATVADAILDRLVRNSYKLNF